jgi:putative copper export protein
VFPDTLAPWLLGAKLALYASALLGIGLSVQSAFGIIEPEARKRVLSVAAFCAFVALIFALLRALLTNAALGAPFDATNFTLVWQTQGAALLAFGGGAALLCIAVFLKLDAVAAVGAIMLAASFALTGHAQGVTDPLLTPLAVAAHVACAGFWIAAPFTLWPSRTMPDEALIARIRRFSGLALAFVPTLFVLGVALALRLAGGVSALLTSLYGLLLIAKLVAATGAMGLGAYNKIVVTHKLESDLSRGRHMLRLTLLADAVLFAAALILVGLATTMTGPPDF